MLEIVNNFINGEFAEPYSKEYLDIYEPATGSVYGKVADSSSHDINRAVESAKDAFPYWSGLFMEERADYLKKIGAEIKKLFAFVPDYKILVSSGVASAISSGFGAPLAGLIFAREVVLRHQSLASFSPILLSSIISYVITTKFFDYEPAFEISSIEVNSLSQIIIIVISLPNFLIESITNLSVVLSRALVASSRTKTDGL